jgi:hypothetical protein
MFRDFYHSIKVGDVVLARRGRKVIAATGTVTRAAYYEHNKNLEALGPSRAYSNHLDVQWKSAPRDEAFPTVVFGMQTLYEIPEEKFRSLLEDEPWRDAQPQDLLDEGPSQPEQTAETSDERKPFFEPFKPLTIGALAAANSTPVFVKRDWEIGEAITRMRINNYSQLPVMPTPWQVDGWVSWKSIGLAGGTCRFIRDCIDDQIVKLWDDHPLLDAVATISEKEVVLIQRRNSKEIIGLLTISDLADHYHSLAEPFLLIGEIENYIRQLISRGEFTIDILRSAKDPSDDRRKIESVSDLSLGECVRFLDRPEHWIAIQIRELKKEPILERLHKVIDIRNRVMHFDPDSSSGRADSNRKDLSTLRLTVRFLGSLKL